MKLKKTYKKKIKENKIVFITYLKPRVDPSYILLNREFHSMNLIYPTIINLMFLLNYLSSYS